MTTEGVRAVIASDRQPLRRAGEVVTLILLLSIGIGGSLLRERGLVHLPSPVGQLLVAVVSVVVIMVAFVAPRWLLLLSIAAVAELLLGGRSALVFVAIYLDALRGRRLLTMCTAVLAVAAMVATNTVHQAPLDALGWLSSFGIYLLLPAVLGSWQRAHRRLVAGLDERAEQAERERELLADRARADERARIAEEMHDVVAHQVSLMVLYAGAVSSRVSAASAGGDRPADHDTLDQVELIRTTGRTTLRQLRDVLGVLRRSDDDGQHAGDQDAEPTQPGLAELDSLVASARAAGLEVSVVRPDDHDPLPTLVDQGAYRVIREAVTNVIKHAGPVATMIELVLRPGVFDVSVGNAPPSADHDQLPGSRTGLVSLRHRVELLDGTFAAGPRPDGGFDVRASWRLPSPVTRPEEFDS